jgi:subtilisin family serine protease
MTKVDPGLLHVVARSLWPAETAAETRTAARPPDVVHVAVKFTGAIDDLRAAGFEPLGTMRVALDGASLAAGRVPLASLGALEAIGHVARIEGSAPARPALKFTVPATKATVLHQPPHNLTGQGVVIGIVDYGIDWRHPNFLGDDGKTRILGIWDQNLTPEPGETSPAAFPNIGVEYTKDQIDAALAGTGTVRTTDDREHSAHHGTMVAGVAAGNGAVPRKLCFAPFTYVGVAPDAYLVVVVLDEDDHREAGEPANFAFALDFIWHHPLAVRELPPGQPGPPEPLPRVINLSLGWGDRGPKDGTTLEEELMAVDVTAVPGRSIVVAAGNDRASGEHARLRLDPGTPPVAKRLPFEVPPGLETGVWLRMWYPAGETVRCSVISPSYQHSEAVEPGEGGEMDVDGDCKVDLTSDTDSFHGRWISVVVRRLSDDAVVPDGMWQVELTNLGASPFDLDAYVQSDREDAVKFTGDHVDEFGTVSTPGTCAALITVGAYSPSGRPRFDATGDLTSYSSFGPNRDGQHKPDLVAPGGVVAPASHEGWELCRWLCWEEYGHFHGTSVASPHVAGIVALMFQHNPDLEHAQVKQLLCQHADTHGIPGPQRLNRWGAGSVDALATINAVPPPATGAPVPTPSPSPAPVGPGSGPAPAPPPLEPPPSERRAGPEPRGRGVDPLSWTLAEAVTRLAAVPGGATWAALVSRHFSEVRALVNHNRRVALRWHRLGGPALIAQLAHLAAGSPRGTVLPSPQLEADRVAAFLTALERHGSPGLAAAVARHRPTILAADLAALLRELGDAARAA